MLSAENPWIRYLDAGGNPVDAQGNPLNVDGSKVEPDPPNGGADSTSQGEDLDPFARLPNGPLGIPRSALTAYIKAADLLAAQQPGCRMHWSLLASIGRIESGHASGGNVDASGRTRAPILGPVLNGAGEFAAITDTDDGAHDGDQVWDRAVGPMQFIPSTWRGYAADGNGDGSSDPNNIYDATLGAGRYLCAGGLDTSDPAQRAAAVFRYNHSNSYVSTVLLWADAYARGVHPTVDTLGFLGGLGTDRSVLAAQGGRAPSGGAKRSASASESGRASSARPAPPSAGGGSGSPRPPGSSSPKPTPTPTPGPTPSPTPAPPPDPSEPPTCEPDDPSTSPSQPPDDEQPGCEPDPSETPSLLPAPAP
ncbi:MAG: hypothetical protein GEU98_16220 [Pseudonocardiaceae bacterium]|nr:hypothetical protein [Pseudonocardiaceae bacterium]